MKKVLVVDDSALMRKLVMGVLREGGYEVQSARNGAEAVQMVVQWQPDVVTLDINMPEMDGLTALSLLMEARPTPVVMFSSLTEKGALATFEALALGAVDFIPKPGGTISLQLDEIAGLLLDKVRSASRARVGGLRRTAATRIKPMSPAASPAAAPAAWASRSASNTASNTASNGAASAAPVAVESPLGRVPASSLAGAPGGLVLIGVSTGGPRTLEDVLPHLPADLPWPVLVAQHMPSNFTDTFARRMNTLCPLTVVEAGTPMPLTPGHIYIGRGGTDMVVSDRGGKLYVAPRPEKSDHLWHPSVQLMVETAMQNMPADRLVGVMLTGMGSDGAAAMTRLRKAGGRTIAESSETAVVFGMPQELIEQGGAMLTLPCHRIAAQLRAWVQRKPSTLVA